MRKDWKILYTDLFGNSALNNEICSYKGMTSSEHLHQQDIQVNRDKSGIKPGAGREIFPLLRTMLLKQYRLREEFIEINRNFSLQLAGCFAFEVIHKRKLNGSASNF